MYYTVAKRTGWGDSMPVVYMDVVWLVNFVVDAALLATTGWIGRHESARSRILLGALVGSLYSLLLFVPAFPVLTAWPGKMAISVLMVYLGVPCKSWLDLVRMTALYYLVAFVYAGAMMALHFAIPGVSVAQGVWLTGQKLAFLIRPSTGLFVGSGVVATFVLKYVLRRVRRINVQQVMLCKVYARIGKLSAEFTGLVDTGNQLRDPISRQPVCLVDADIMAQLLPGTLARAITAGTDLFTALENAVEDDFSQRVCLIPYRGAGGASVLTVAIRPDELQLEYEGLRRAAAVPCLLAVHRQGLSHDKRFQAILHAEVITGDDQFEDALDFTKLSVSLEDPPATVVDSNST